MNEQKKTPPVGWCFLLAEKEGFEPSIPFWGIHDFQSCALGQLRDFSMSTAIAVSLCIILYLTEFVKTYFFFRPPHLLREKSVDTAAFYGYNVKALKYASVAQSVVHLTRNEKVACSSQVTSSNNSPITVMGLLMVYYPIFS